MLMFDWQAVPNVVGNGIGCIHDSNVVEVADQLSNRRVGFFEIETPFNLFEPLVSVSELDAKFFRNQFGRLRVVAELSTTVLDCFQQSM